MSQVDVVIVQKQTALERYTRRPLNIDFFEYLGKAGEDVEGLVEAHDEHVRTRELLISILNKQAVSFEIMNLDELQDKRRSYFSDTIPGSGFHPKKSLVISLGGDGTLLHASHYVGDDVCLLGVNSCPEHSVGHLCAASPDTLEQVIQDFFSGRAPIQKIRRLKVALPGLQTLPLGLNDVLFANRHPGATCRYQLSIKGVGQEEAIISERHLSSGVWIASPAGSTAAISSYGLPRLPLHSEKFLMAVREAYLPPGRTLELKKRELDGNTELVELFCRIRQGIVCVDGADSCVYLGFGDTIEVSSPKSCSLLLLLPAHALA